jgi:signal transduction histidine kinase
LRSIRVYLLVLVVGAMLPGVIITAVLVWRSFAETRAAGERRLIEAARVDASALDREFDGTIRALEVLAAEPALQRDDIAAFDQDARRVQATQPGWYSIVLLSSDGQQLVNTRIPWGEPLGTVVDPESLRRLVATKAPVVGRVRSAPSGPDYAFSVRVPVTRDGRVRYALSASVTVGWLARIVPPQSPESEEWSRNILDPDGTIAVRSRGPEEYIGTQASEAFKARIREARESVSSQTTRDGVPVYAAVSRGAYDWSAVVVVPHATLDAAMTASLTGLSIGGALLMLSGLAAVLLVSRRLSDDLAAATMAAEAVSEGGPVPATRAHVKETQQLQRSLATAASLLERRARERDEEVRRADSARAEAEQANQTKDQFLAVLGHELRNPLAPALTALEVMKLRDPDVFTRERQVLERQVAHMARLVNDLLDVSRLARGKVHLRRQRFELREAVDRAVDMARPLIAQRRHAFTVTVPVTGLAIDGDSDRIVQVLANLLTNAATYTPPGGTIALTAAAVDDHVVVVCDDDGPGVAPELLPTLFDPFAQGPRALDRRQGGLGLGLALARTFTELHGGTIRVEGRGDDRGSRFVVSLPLATATAAEPADEEPVPIVRTHDGRRVLVVDDNVDACEMLRAALRHSGHELAVAGNGPDAMARAAEFHPDVAVVDIGLPDMNGYELARRLRAAHPGLRLIALTGYGQTSDLAAASAAGFDAHCTKPIALTALLDRIEPPGPAVPEGWSTA